MPGLFDPTDESVIEGAGLPADVSGGGPQRKPDWKRLAPLLALLPVVLAKGGRSGAAGLLQGYQQAQERQRGHARQDQQDARQGQLDQENREYRQAQIGSLDEQREAARQNQDVMRRQTFLQQFGAGLEKLDTPEAVQAYLALQGAQGQSLGIGQDELTAMAPTPTALERRKATKALEALQKQRPDDWMNWSATIDGKPVKATDLLGIVRDPTSPVAAPKDKRGFVAKEITLNGRRMLANFDPDNGQYYGIGSDRPLTGEILDYQKPTATGGGGPGSAADSRINARVDRVVSTFNGSPIVKEFNEVQAQHATIQDLVSRPWTGPGDMSIVFSFMKALDPSSVVRETEYDNASKSGNIFAGWAARFNGKLNPSGGFLSEQVKRDFLGAISGRLGVKRKQYDNLRGQLVKRVDRIRSGAPETGDEALIDYASAIPSDTGAAPAGGGVPTYQDYVNRQRRPR